MVAEESNIKWADSDSDESTSSSSSSDSEEEEVHFLMEDDNDEPALSKLTTENEELRSRSQEMMNVNQLLAEIISSWTKSSTSLQKFQGAMKPSGDKSGLGYGSDERNIAETCTHPNMDRSKLQTMNFVKSSMGQPEESNDESHIATKP
ncbi:chromatin structure-remodeling complex protein SYD [Dorcoceras hygrometricum]|uniref:Chromatin structure-remodeling complex protein SYD n=1 Tax=Dorcoceras hygrometricum TaxID=472368 RepID=A0A2Z7BZ77_9LAMI|nr:chromatin structure-remodeling complex protein SYD [Dorcoceras hygrometricum]